MNRRHYRKPTIALCATVFLLGAGCGAARDHGAIGGEVKLDGKAVEHGYIVFMPIKGTHGTATGAPVENGRYRIAGKDGPAVGWNRVEIQSPRKCGRTYANVHSPTRELVNEEVEAVAPQFNSASTLTFEVKPGENTANFDVTSK